MPGDHTHMLSQDQFVNSGDRYHGESDSQYTRRKAMESRMAGYEPTAKPAADPFAGIPQPDEDKW
jgi:hypothetical protein